MILAICIALIVASVWIAIPRLAAGRFAERLRTDWTNAILELLHQLGVVFTPVHYAVASPSLFFMAVSNHLIQSLAFLSFRNRMIITMLHRHKDPSVSLATVG